MRRCFTKILIAGLIAAAAVPSAADPSVEVLFRDLHDPDEKVRARAVKQIADRGLGESAVRPLLRALGDPAVDVRGSAADALGGLGADARRPFRPS